MQFDRFVDVLIGRVGSEEAMGVSKLRTVFKVTKTGKKTTNKATVDIYNLSRESFNKVNDNRQESVLILKAGYVEADTQDSVVFAGDIRLAKRVQKGADMISTFECADGDRALNITKVSVSYAAGSSARKILFDLINQFPLADQLTVQIPAGVDAQYVNGFSAVGLLRDIFTNVADFLGLEWSIQNYELKIILKDGNDGTRAVLLSPSTGLIGSPVRLNDTTISGQKKAGAPGWKVVSLLQPKIEPNGVIAIESAEIEAGSNFKVISVEHEGDTHSNKFVSTTEALSI